MPESGLRTTIRSPTPFATVADITEALQESEARLEPPLRPVRSPEAVARAALEREAELGRRAALRLELADLRARLGKVA